MTCSELDPHDQRLSTSTQCVYQQEYCVGEFFVDLVVLNTMVQETSCVIYFTVAMNFRNLIQLKELKCSILAAMKFIIYICVHT